MASFNQIQVMGNVGSDPEYRELDNGKKVATLSIAVTESYTNRLGERIQSTEWFKCEFWDKPAETIEKYVHKGSSLFVQGPLKMESWNDREGNIRTTPKIRVQNFQLLGGTGNPKLPENGITNSPPAQKEPQQPRPQTPVPPSLSVSGDDDDLPF